MKVRLFLSVVLLLACAGCEDLLRKEPPPPPPSGPQTKEEVAALVNPLIQPLRQSVAGGPGISEAERYSMLAALRNAVIQYGATDFGRQALNDVAYEVQDIAKQAADIERYRLVLICIDVEELLSVESQLLQRLGERADIMLDKPSIQVQGFMDDIEKDQTYIFLNIINRREGKIERKQVREGDELSDIRVIKIIGRNRGVLFEYLKVPGLFFEVDAF
ncbi:MAG: hypothetical protein GX117_11770 [Candidatus Hydrogenedentes bacterium]|jgi:hypothetical protein|nr:hypothetical protein [Candidatus Hydrogenedentota bacterium]